MTVTQDNLQERERSPIFAPTGSPVRKWVKDLGMRLVGRGSAGLGWLLGDRESTALGILAYHRVSPNIAGLPKPHHNVTPQAFHEQLLGLRKRGFTFWSLAKALEHHSQHKDFPPRTVVVTFDDGFASVYTNALPILRELDIPATLFVNTAYLDTQDPFPFDLWGQEYSGQVPPESYRPLTTRQCHTLVDSGLFDIGAHTHTHEDFRGRPEAFQVDLQESIDWVSQEFLKTDVSVAFPYGSPRLGFAGGELEAAARHTDATCALTMEAVLVKSQDDPFRWGRFGVFDWDTSTTLSGKLQGWYSWGPKLYGWFAERTRKSIR